MPASGLVTKTVGVKRIRVGAVHALKQSIQPTTAAFESGWSTVEVSHLLDGSLYLDRSQGTADASELARRIQALLAYSCSTDSDGIIFTGSFFGDAVAQARSAIGIPVLRSFDGVLDEALREDCPLYVLSTAEDSVVLLQEEFRQEVQRRALSTTVSGHVVEGALTAVVSGDVARHDELVLNAVESVDPEATIVFAQFSMERVLSPAIELRRQPVVGPATSAVRLLRRKIERL